MIKIGNDEAILYVRKNGYGQGRSTADLGRRIGDWLLRHGATVAASDQPCLWGDSGSFIQADALPKTATQFNFDPKFLPDLYAHLAKL